MSHLDDQRMSREVARRVSEKGGRTFYIGGFVRDALIHRENKDADIEVHGISPKCLEEILDSLGQQNDHRRELWHLRSGRLLSGHCHAQRRSQ